MDDYCRICRIFEDIHALLTDPSLYMSLCVSLVASLFAFLIIDILSSFPGKLLILIVMAIFFIKINDKTIV